MMETGKLILMDTNSNNIGSKYPEPEFFVFFIQ